MSIIQTIGTALNQALSDERLQSFSNSNSLDGSQAFAFKTMSGESFEFTFHRDGTTQPPVSEMLGTLERLGIAVSA